MNVWVEFLQDDNSRLLIQRELIYAIEEILGSKARPSGRTLIHYNDIKGYEAHSAIVKESYDELRNRIFFEIGIRGDKKNV